MKGIRQMPSLRKLKSIRSIGARSIPKVQRSADLELYTLRREKDRLEKEMFALDKKRSAAKQQLKSIDKRIGKLQKETYQKQCTKTHRNIPTEPLKTMPISY